MKALKITDIILSILFLLSFFEIELLSHDLMDFVLMITAVYLPISVVTQSILYLTKKKTKKGK